MAAEFSQRLEIGNPFEFWIEDFWIRVAPLIALLF